MREAIGAVIIKNGCILLVQKKKTWILPGGKPEFGESDIKCLSRELREELQVSLRSLKRFDDEFIGITPNKGDLLCLRVYLTEIESEMVPSAEIKAAEWTKAPESYDLSDITQKVICSLRQKGYL